MLKKMRNFITYNAKLVTPEKFFLSDVTRYTLHVLL